MEIISQSKSDDPGPVRKVVEPGTQEEEACEEVNQE